MQDAAVPSSGATQRVLRVCEHLIDVAQCQRRSSALVGEREPGQDPSTGFGCEWLSQRVQHVDRVPEADHADVTDLNTTKRTHHISTCAFPLTPH